MQYAKVFDSIWNGSMRGQSDPLFVFVNMLTHAGQDGVVDRHWKAIMEETGLSEERVKAAIAFLESPDPESRTPDEHGKRIVKLDGHRTWGWRIVNHRHYQELCTRKQNAERQQRFRDRNGRVTGNRYGALPPVGVGVGVGVGVDVSSEKEEKHPHGELQKVMLTTDEYSKLQAAHPPADLAKAIEILDGYIASTGKRYKNHYAVLKADSWVWQRVANPTGAIRHERAPTVSRIM